MRPFPQSLSILRRCKDHTKRTVIVFLYVALSLAINGIVQAQVANNTSLVGNVTDSGGNAIAGAAVTALNEASRVTYRATTNGQGYYAVTFISPGSYDLTVERSGFATHHQVGITVQQDEKVRTDLVLNVGAVSQSVTVTSATPAIQTDSAAVEETISSRSVADLPMNGRNPLNLAVTTAGVILGPKSGPGIPPGNDYIGAGTREIDNSLTEDGITIMNDLIDTTPVVVNADATREVQVQTGTYSAQYGDYMGVHINIVTKSGTNALHGALYEYVQNTLFNANGFFAKPGTPKNPLHLNQFGFEVGGPVYIPSVYNGHDKTFFMGSYEGFHDHQSVSQLGSTLTPKMRAGDFSEQPIQVINPFTGVSLPGNKAPASLLSPQAQKILQYIPLPTGSGVTNNYDAAVPADNTTNQTVDRIDHNIGDKIRLFFRYDWQNSSYYTGNINPTSSVSAPTQNTNIAFGYTQTITPNLVNDFRFGRNHIVTNALNYWEINGLKDAGSLLGIPGFTGDVRFNNPGIPVMSISNFIGAGNGGTNWYQDDTVWHGFDQVSYMHGNHSIQAGIDMRKLTVGRAAANDPSGNFVFNGAMSNYAPADFIFGTAQNDTTQANEPKGVFAEWRDAFYVLDEWQVSHKLTLNIGLRYELPTVPYSVNGIVSELNPSHTALIPTTIPDKGFKLSNPNHNDWAPRAAFAYRVTDRSVVQGGAGIYYNANQVNAYTLTTTNPPFTDTTTFATVAGNPTITFNDPTPGQNAQKVTYLSVYSVNPNLPTPRMYQWSLGFGQDLWRNAGLQLTYLGSHALHLDREFFDNTPLPGPGNNINARRPNQLWGSIRLVQNDEIANYNGLTALLRQRLTHGVEVMASYTWSHDLDMTTDSNGGGAPMNPYNIWEDYGNSNWNIPNRFVSTVVYSLPTFSSFNPVIHSVLGGWQMNDIFTLQSGIPINVTMSQDIANTGSGNQRPNRIGSPSANCGFATITNCIKLSPYAPPANYTYGNLARNQISGPSYFDTDFSLFKSIPITKRAIFELRGEAFNLLNHPQFSNPNSVIPVSGSFSRGFTFSRGNFGTITSTAGNTNMRVIQLAGKLVF